MNGDGERAAVARTRTSSPRALETTHRLLRRARAGDRDALDLVLDRYLKPLQRWARGRLPRYARGMLDTDDLVQETLFRTVRGVTAEGVRGFEPRHSGAFRGYLHRGILNGVRDEIRRFGRRPAADGTASRLPDAGPSPLEEALGKESLLRYEQALGKLKPAVREAVVARLELGLGYAEIAALLDKPSEDAARMTVSRALVRLAREMRHVRP